MKKIQTLQERMQFPLDLKFELLDIFEAEIGEDTPICPEAFQNLLLQAQAEVIHNYLESFADLNDYDHAACCQYVGAFAEWARGFIAGLVAAYENRRTNKS